MPGDARREAVAAVNAWNAEDAQRELLACCASRRWATALADGRPYGGWTELAAAATAGIKALRSTSWTPSSAARRPACRSALRRRAPTAGCRWPASVPTPTAASDNPNETFLAADRPYGLIEGDVRRDDAPDAGPAWT